MYIDIRNRALRGILPHHPLRFCNFTWDFEFKRAVTRKKMWYNYAICEFLLHVFTETYWVCLVWEGDSFPTGECKSHNYTPALFPRTTNILYQFNFVDYCNNKFTWCFHKTKFIFMFTMQTISHCMNMLLV